MYEATLLTHASDRGFAVMGQPYVESRFHANQFECPVSTGLPRPRHKEGARAAIHSHSPERKVFAGVRPGPAVCGNGTIVYESIITRWLCIFPPEGKAQIHHLVAALAPGKARAGFKPAPTG